MSNLALVDVKYVDGEPWEVAQVAGKQVTDAITLTEEALEGFFWAARGSWLSQEEYRTGEVPGAGAFEASPLGRRIAGVAELFSEAQSALDAAKLSAVFDPRSF